MTAVTIDVFQFIQGLALSLVIAYAALRKRSLSGSGAVAAIAIGTIVYGLGGLVWAVPLVYFFVSSSLLSYLKSDRKKAALAAADKTGPRDWRQVIANGGMAAVAVIVFAVSSEPAWYLVFLAALSEAAADTWATEIGTMSRTIPISMIGFRPVSPGESGGITMLGNMAALTGAFTTAFAGYVAVGTLVSPDMFAGLFWITAALAGWAGSFGDSILGAALQGQFHCPVCGKTTEKRYHCGRAAELCRGRAWLDNDVVNLAGTLLAALLMLAASAGLII